LMATVAVSVLAAGCGTTRMSDTARTGTEQLLLSSAVDRAIDNLDFRPMAGKDVFLETQYLEGITDKNYIISSLRQHMWAHGCILKEKRDDATYVVEARAGALGTNRQDVMLGIPAINLPAAGLLPGAPAAIPEVPFAKSTDQKGIAKIAVFAYNQKTNEPVWQSGVFPVASNAKDTWIMGAGPFQKGTIYDGTRFAGSRLLFSGSKRDAPMPKPAIPVTAEAVFEERPVVAQAPTEHTSQATAPSAVSQAHALESAPAELPGQDAGVQAPMPLEEIPAGRIVRLPPLEQAARPDLTGDAGSDDSTDQSGDPLLFEYPAAGSSGAEPSKAKPARFRLFQPGTWFGNSESEDDSEVISDVAP